MPEKRKKQKSLLEFEKKDHIPLSESNTETKKKSGRKAIPPSIENLSEHSKVLATGLEESFEVSMSRRRIYQTDNFYFKIAFTNEVYYNERDLLNNGIELLIVLDNNKAIVRLPDTQITELADKIRHYEEMKFKSMLMKLSSIEPLRTDEKIGATLEDEIKNSTEDKLMFVEVRLFPNLDKDEYSKVLESIKKYITNKREEFISETLSEKRAKARVKIRLSSIRELTEGVEPISKIEKVPRYHIGFSRLGGIDNDLREFQPQIQEDSPTVCVIDSGVVEDHPLLQGVIDEVVDFTEETQDGYDNDGHGTFVAGLVAYGNSFHNIRHPDTKIAVAKVMNKDGDPIDLENTLPEVVERFYRKTRVFNMSISKEDYCRPLDTELASKIDELEHKYNVVFCIPTGNIRLNEIEKFINKGENYPSYLEKTESLLLQPGESCNAITVGSIVRKGSSVSLAGPNEPSPFTRRGPTPEGRTKPDFVEFDGNVAHVKRPNGVHVYEDVNISTISLNSAFENDYLTAENGTSFATALVSRHAAKLMQKFPASPNLIKALLVNSIDYKQLSRRNKRILGHGMPILENALNSTPCKVTYYLESSVNMKYEKIVKFRMPEEMGKIRGKKRLYIILVYNPPVDSSKKYYVLTALDFKLHKGGTGERIFQNPSLANWIYDNRNNKWDNVKVAIYEWQRAGWGEDWDIHIIPHYPRALEYIDYNQRFALVVTLEDITGTVDIHTAVLNELGITVKDIERVRVKSDQRSILELL
ncbi:MAG: S8 family peptidase [Theionarchaea archaeon]|nr:S8 family peptidase [Theionarchaea archaeon]